MKPKVYAFDFDGTLTTGDSLLLFLKYVCGNRLFYKTMLRFMPLLVLMKLHLYNNGRLKQKIFKHIFRTFDLDFFDECCHDFSEQYWHIIRPIGRETIRKAVAEGSKVIIVSASIENWVRPFFEEFGDKIVFACTKIELRKERLTGRFITPNCYGKEKVRRILEVFPDRENYHLTAFGDSRGDKEMLEFADESYYKPFR